MALPPDPAVVMTADAGGRLWFGYVNNRIALLDGDSVRMFGIADGLNVGNVTAIATRGKHVWVGGEHGLVRFDGSHFVPVRVTGESPYRLLWGLVETQAGELWAAGGQSLIRLDRSQVGDVLADRVPASPPQVFDYRDGIIGTVQSLRPLPVLQEAGDGRLWFALSNGLGYLDPNQIAHPVPPPPGVDSEHHRSRTRIFPVPAECSAPDAHNAATDRVHGSELCCTGSHPVSI